MRLILVVAAALVALWCGPARAQIYTDYASWAAAIPAGDVIEPSPGRVTLTEQILTSTALGGCAFTVSGPTTVVTSIPFTSLNVRMAFLGDCSQGPGGLDHEVEEATVSLGAVDGIFTDITIGVDNVTLNGISLYQYSKNVGEIGLVGVPELDFVSSTVGTDNPDFVYLDNILAAVPAPIPEPPTLLLLGAGIVILRRLRRTGN